MTTPAPATLANLGEFDPTHRLVRLPQGRKSSGHALLNPEAVLVVGVLVDWRGKERVTAYMRETGEVVVVEYPEGVGVDRPGVLHTGETDEPTDAWRLESLYELPIAWESRLEGSSPPVYREAGTETLVINLADLDEKALDRAERMLTHGAWASVRLCESHNPKHPTAVLARSYVAARSLLVRVPWLAKLRRLNPRTQDALDLAIECETLPLAAYLAQQRVEAATADSAAVSPRAAKMHTFANRVTQPDPRPFSVRMAEAQLAEVRASLELIVREDAQGRHEEAHAAEERLMLHVLRMIAEGRAVEPASLARLVVDTLDADSPKG